jgi:hypothetical protein
MTTEERVLTALRREQPDRVPVFLYLDPFIQYWATEDPSYAEVMTCAKEYLDVIFEWAPDMGFFLSGGIDWRTEQTDDRLTYRVQTPKGELTSVLQRKWNGGWGETKFWLETPQDVERILSIPYQPLQPKVDAFLETRQRRKGQAIAQCTLPDPVGMVGLIKPEELAVWTLTERALLKEYVEVAFVRMRDLVASLLENDVGPLFYFNGPEFAIPPLMSPADFEEFVVAYDKPLVDMIHAAGKFVIIHSHGKVNQFLERFVEIGTDGLNVLEPPPMGDVDLADAKRRVGKDMCLIGNIEYDDLAKQTPERIDAMVKECIEQAGAGGGFILSPSANPYESPITPQTAANFVAYMQAGRKYGVYA